MSSIANPVGRTFWPFCNEHKIALVVSVIAIILLCRIGLDLRKMTANGEAHESVLRLWNRGLVVFGFVIVAMNETWYLQPHLFSWSLSLPLHFCDLNGFVAPFALVHPEKRILRSLLYFWGVLGGIIGLGVPILLHGATTMRFWLYWVSHWVLFSYAIYDIVVNGFRPTPADFMEMLGASSIYYVLLLALNTVTGWNYGYNGPTGERTPPEFESLGPWPARALTLYMIIVAILVLLYLPFVIYERLSSANATTTTTKVKKET